MMLLLIRAEHGKGKTCHTLACVMILRDDRQPTVMIMYFNPCLLTLNIPQGFTNTTDTECMT